MVSVSQHPSVHRAAFFLDTVQITPSPAFPGFCVASFLGSGPPFFFFRQQCLFQLLFLTHTSL